MTQAERRRGFQEEVEGQVGQASVKAQHGVSNAAVFSEGALRVGVPNLRNYEDSDGALVIISELKPMPATELHVAIEIASGAGVEAWLDTMKAVGRAEFADDNGNVAVFLANDGRVYLHNKGKSGTDHDTIQDIIAEAGTGFACKRAWIGSHVGDATGRRIRKDVVGWLKSAVGDQAVVEFRDGARRKAKGKGEDLQECVETFSEALRDAGLTFGADHIDFVRAFVVSLVTKRLAILTGLSGSGKTQIALRFGEWLGEGRSAVIPVRPDWTGPEYVLGYEDVLRERSEDGRGAWQVPETLAFILSSLRDPEHPYLLLLDEMNLAHVERYFADILSGMETGEPCVPNLAIDEDGAWRIVAGGPIKVPLPSNLFVVGTVNIDETTYMFSPKVLDRANSLEFRVPTGALDVASRRPSRVPAGDESLVAALLAVSEDEGWHSQNPHPNEIHIAEALREVHGLLCDPGFEFGHRVFFETLRFSAILAASGQNRWEAAVDLQVLQKVLPRLHGSRRRLESTLRILASFCYSEDPPNPDFEPEGDLKQAPRFPLSFDKLRRMTRRLRANQFVSFAE